MRSLGADLLQTTTTIAGVTQTTTVNGNGAFLDKGGVRSGMSIWFAESRIAEGLPVISIQSWIQRTDLTIAEVTTQDDLASSLRRFHVQKMSDGSLQGDADQQIYDFTVSVDSATLQIRSISEKWFSDDTLTNFIKIDINYGDYRLIDGMLTPFHISYYGDGTMLSDVVLTSSDVLSTNAPADFN